jgi:hypothetical protein
MKPEECVPPTAHRGSKLSGGRLRRLQAAKKQREREKKDNELLSRKPLANVRVKHKNQVHIQGMTARTANEDVRARPDDLLERQ